MVTANSVIPSPVRRTGRDSALDCIAIARREINLIQHMNDAHRKPRQQAIIMRLRTGCVFNNDGQIGTGKCRLGQYNSGCFEFVLGHPQAGCVGQLDRPAVDGRGQRHDIACRARRRRDDCPLVPGQRVDETAFADVRRAGEDDAPGRGEMQADITVAQEAVDRVGRSDQSAAAMAVKQWRELLRRVRR